MFNQAMALSLLRQVLLVGGGALVARGYFDTETMNQIVGAILILGSSAWALYTRTRTGQVANVAAVLEPGEKVVLKSEREARAIPDSKVVGPSGA